MRRLPTLAFTLLFCSAGLAFAQQPDVSFKSTFDSGIGDWSQYFEPGRWNAKDGVLTVGGKNTTVALTAPIPDTADCLVQTDVRVLSKTKRANFGVLFRAQKNGDAYVLRHYDAFGVLQLLDYRDGGVKGVPRDVKVPYKHDTWYTLKIGVVGKTLLAKMWPAGTEEPDWQSRHTVARTSPGKTGLYVGDCSLAEFRNIQIDTGGALAALKKTIAQEERKAAEELRKRLECEVRKRRSSCGRRMALGDAWSCGPTSVIVSRRWVERFPSFPPVPTSRS